MPPWENKMPKHELKQRKSDSTPGLKVAEPLLCVATNPKWKGNLGNTLFNSVKLYCENPSWTWHSLSVLPILLAKSDKSTPFWKANQEEEDYEQIFSHLFCVLARWSAFRGKTRREVLWARTQKCGWDFIKYIQSAARNVTCLADFTQDEVKSFSAEVDENFIWFDANTKKTRSRSRVFPSKFARLMLPNYIATFDNEIIRDQVLPYLVVGSKRCFIEYIQLCWLIIQALKKSNQLALARQEVVNHLVSEWTVVNIIDPAVKNQACLSKLDGLVAEYALTGWTYHLTGAERIKPFVAVDLSK
jgi:hypothetical protein